jgi:hypothetical protein
MTRFLLRLGATFYSETNNVFCPHKVGVERGSTAVIMKLLPGVGFVYLATTCFRAIFSRETSLYDFETSTTSGPETNEVV